MISNQTFPLTLSFIQRLIQRETGDGATVEDVNEVPPSTFPLPVSLPNRRASSSSGNEEDNVRQKYVHGKNMSWVRWTDGLTDRKTDWNEQLTEEYPTPAMNYEKEYVRQNYVHGKTEGSWTERLNGMV